MVNCKTNFNDYKRLGPLFCVSGNLELWQSSSCLVPQHLVKIEQSDSCDTKTLKRWRETMHTKELMQIASGDASKCSLGGLISVKRNSQQNKICCDVSILVFRERIFWSWAISLDLFMELQDQLSLSTVKRWKAQFGSWELGSGRMSSGMLLDFWSQFSTASGVCH